MSPYGEGPSTQRKTSYRGGELGLGSELRAATRNKPGPCNDHPREAASIVGRTGPRRAKPHEHRTCSWEQLGRPPGAAAEAVASRSRCPVSCKVCLKGQRNTFLSVIRLLSPPGQVA
ncbi:uncharacterized protein LOC144108082 [Amblyomma americanum]